MYWSWTHQRTPETVFEAPFRLSFQFHILGPLLLLLFYGVSVDAATDGYTGSTPDRPGGTHYRGHSYRPEQWSLFPVSNVEVTWDEMDLNIWMPALPYGTRNETIRLSPESTESGTATPRQCWGDGADFDIRKDRTLLETVGFITWSMRRWRTVDTRKPMPPTAII